MRFLSIYQVAYAVWNQIPVASRTVSVTTNNDKTGYSLTAGSYSIRASSTQSGTITISGGTGTSSPSSVTTTRAVLDHLGTDTGASDSTRLLGRVSLTGSTTVTGTANTDSGVMGWFLAEYF